MSRISPTAEGFRATWRRPALTFAEITWRWTVGATGSALFLFGLIEYLRTLPVNRAELFFLRTRQPVLVGQAIAHILRGTVDRAVLATLVGAIALAGLWIVAASVARAATVHALLEYFAVRREVSSDVSPESSERGEAVSGRPETHWRALLDLNFLRVALLVAAIFGLEGASILAGFASPDSNPQPGLSFFLFLPLAFLIWLIWSLLNWFLSLATVFAVRDRSDALSALSAAASFWRDRPGPVFAVSSWNGLAHVAAFIGASIVVSLPLSLLAVVPWRLVLACILLVGLAYFAFVDWLYTARLAGYVCILEMPEALLAPAPPLPVPRPSIPVETTIDRQEPILSDIPELAVDT